MSDFLVWFRKGYRMDRRLLVLYHFVCRFRGHVWTYAIRGIPIRKGRWCDRCGLIDREHVPVSGETR